MRSRRLPSSLVISRTSVNFANPDSLAHGSVLSDHSIAQEVHNRRRDSCLLRRETSRERH